MEALDAYDLGLLYWFGSLHRPWLDPVVMAWTHLGDFAILGSLSALLTLVFLWSGQRYTAALFAGVCLVAVGVEWGVKEIVRRPRPQVVWRLIPLPNEPSFPSGHSLCSMAIYPTAALLVGRWLRRRWVANLLLVLAVLLALSIGLSRPYLGVHYPSDVLAGFVAGLAIVLFGASVAGPRPTDAPEPRAGLPAG